MIRPAGEDDVAACVALAVAERGADPAREAARFGEDVALGGRLWVAEVDGGLAGYARLVQVEERLYLLGVLVAMEHRRRGIGQALTRARIESALDRTDEVWYFANSRNTASLELHARLGFEEVQRGFTFPNVSFEGGEGVLCRLRARRRDAVRVLLRDERGRVLLFRAEDRGAFWFPPGGGLQAGEDVRAAAAREVAEETGLTELALGPELWRRRDVFTWRGVTYDQRERWFLARVAHFTPSRAGLTGHEPEDLTASRWWSVEELERTTDRLVPPDLAARLRALDA